MGSGGQVMAIVWRFSFGTGGGVSRSNTEVGVGPGISDLES